MKNDLGKNDLLKELADLDLIMEKLESRRTHVVNMLSVIETLTTLKTSASQTDQVQENVVPISVPADDDDVLPFRGVSRT